MQAGISPPWGALEHMWSITVIPVGLKELGLYTHHIVGHGLWAGCEEGVLGQDGVLQLRQILREL